MALLGGDWKDDNDWDRGMSFFSNCSGDCEDCLIYYVGGCIAGHGDDDFVPMSDEEKEKYNVTIRKK